MVLRFSLGLDLLLDMSTPKDYNFSRSYSTQICLREQTRQKERNMAFELPKLPYPEDALEPYIDAQTMDIHHTKHHQAYITNLNAALEKHTELANKSLEELLSDLNAIPEDIRMAVRNHGGGTWNHNLFWEIMAPKMSATPSGDLMGALESAFGSF